jgi:alpha-1,2-mannosyltransferase
MAAGLIMVAHRSGGPLMDIVVESEGSQNGFLAADENEYAQAIASILKLSPHTRRVIQDAARYVKPQYCKMMFYRRHLCIVVPPYLLIQYLQFTAAPQKFGKLKK